ncbi:MAG TPA: four helix bundle protein [Candidatus Saccharimonadales bacterium]|nr:four helix bundle protein [Candidatus Saccharimonadales bacterium]
MNPIGQTSKFKVQNSDKLQVSSPKMQPFDLEERMSKFGEDIVIFCRGLRVDHVSRPIVTQLVRSATSIGANYAEANNASSKKDFRNKVHIVKKEVQETKHWLRMLKPCYPEHDEQIMTFWQEAHEFTLILQTIVNKISQKVEV